jgi:hypothetical protein
MTRALSCLVALALTSTIFTGFAQSSSDASQLVRQLAEFEPALAPGIAGQPAPAEQRRAEIYAQLRTLADRAVPALRSGLIDEDVRNQAQRGVVFGRARRRLRPTLTCGCETILVAVSRCVAR